MLSFCFFRGASCCDSRRSLFSGVILHVSWSWFFQVPLLVLGLTILPFPWRIILIHRKFMKNKSFLSQATFPTAPWTFAPPKLWVLKSWTSPRRFQDVSNREKSDPIPNETKRARKTRVRWVCVGFSLWYSRDWSILHQHLFGKSQGFWSRKGWRLLLEFFPWILKPTKKTPAVEKERIDRISDSIEISPLKLNSKFWTRGQLEDPDDLTAFFVRMPKR